MNDELLRVDLKLLTPGFVRRAVYTASNGIVYELYNRTFAEYSSSDWEIVRIETKSQTFGTDTGTIVEFRIARNVTPNNITTLTYQ